MHLNFNRLYAIAVYTRHTCAVRKAAVDVDTRQQLGDCVVGSPYCEEETATQSTPLIHFRNLVSLSSKLIIGRCN